MDKGRSSRQDNTSREGVGVDDPDSLFREMVKGLRGPLSARTSADTPTADCPSSQSKDAT